MNAITRTEIERLESEGKIVRSHTSLFRGYVSRKGECTAQPYQGKFGKGYVLYSPNHRSTLYSYKTYFIEA